MIQPHYYTIVLWLLSGGDKMNRQKILPDRLQYRTDIQVMTDRQGNSFAVQKATGRKMVMVSHDVIDSIEYQQLSDGACCLYLG